MEDNLENEIYLVIEIEEDSKDMQNILNKYNKQGYKIKFISDKHSWIILEKENLNEDYYDDNEDYEEDEEEYEIAKKIVKHEDFKNYSKDEKSVRIFIKKYFPELFDEWEDFAIDEIIDLALNYSENPDEIEKKFTYSYEEFISDEEEEEYARKIAEHHEFPRYCKNQSTREYFIRKYFPDIYKKVNKTSSFYEILNLSKGIYDSEIKKEKK